ncbi:MAG: acyl-CoA/acyl-ACP dehydrogenase, partial [Deltaproteobacteria bacterium]
QGLAREILEKEVTPERRNEIARDPDGFDRAVWGELAKANLLGAALPESVGGSDCGFLGLCLLLQEVGRALAPIPALPTLAVGASAIAEFGSDAQKRRLLPGVASGDTILSAALLEPGADGSAELQTRVRPDGGGFRLDGLKTCVPAAHLAECILVPARADDGATSVFLLDPRTDGVTLERQETTNGEPQFRLRLDGASASEALGDARPGAALRDWMTERATTAVCAIQLGVSERALEITADYTRERRQFDRPIGSFQAVHQRAADAFIQLEAMRLTTWQAAWQLEQHASARDAVAVAKFWAAEGGQFVGYAAQHLHGGIGVDIEYPIARYYLWAKQLELSLGSASRQLARLGERIADGSASVG